jgi:osmoprotectant transport system ATP-binding protein
MPIEFRNVSKRFPDGTTAVEDFSLTIPSRSTTVLVGSSGCGKTTLLRMINRMVDPTSGSILIDGEDVSGIPPVGLRRRIGYVMQNSGLLPHRTVADNVATVPVLTGVPKRKAREDALGLLDRVGLDRSLANRYPAQLSGGQRQRMGLARALAVDPTVLLLDEPFGALDARVRGELRTWLRRLHDETHTTTVIVTHDQEEAMEVADRVVVMNRGRVEQAAAPLELYESPANEFVMSFVGRANRYGDGWVRPHDLQLTLEPHGSAREAMVERLVHLGFEVRAELVRDDGARVSVQLTRDEAAVLELEAGQIVYVRPLRQTVFS